MTWLDMGGEQPPGTNVQFWKTQKKKKKKKRREIKTENSIRKLSDEQIKEMNETAKGLERLEGCIFIYLFIRWC